ncbi:hypothetical protein GN958_ATG17950 [Phytophthora infestans]|uniref:RxLR effector protein n=1 Tax=Phytophthora infestans TaxID=4787 RepID=A0A8S9TXW4_PHYIN|nr:hypothetical protein GN958_ATG17950 [Phytophthora infestans]
MRASFVVCLVSTIIYAVCGAYSGETSASLVKISEARIASRDGGRFDSDNQKRQLRSRDADGAQRQLKTWRSAGERVIEWVRKGKQLEDVKDTMLVTSAMDKLDPKLRLYKKFGNALLKDGEPKHLYKKWEQSKWDKLLGCLQPPCVAP